MIKQYQVTMFDKENHYRPVSAIVKMDDSKSKQEIAREGQRKIMQKRLWTMADLKRYGYTGIKVREYDPEKIAEENAARYEAIKEAKYTSGEWKRPKKDN